MATGNRVGASLFFMLGSQGAHHCPEKASRYLELWPVLPFILVVMAHLTSTSLAITPVYWNSFPNQLQTSLYLELWSHRNQAKAGPENGQKKGCGHRPASRLPGAYKSGYDLCNFQNY